LTIDSTCLLELLQRLAVRRFKAAADAPVNPSNKVSDCRCRSSRRWLTIRRAAPGTRERLLLHAINPRSELLQPFRRLITFASVSSSCLVCSPSEPSHRRTLRRALLLQLFPQLLRLVPASPPLPVAAPNPLPALSARSSEFCACSKVALTFCESHSAPRPANPSVPCCFHKPAAWPLPAVPWPRLHLLRMGPQLRRPLLPPAVQHRLQRFLRARQLLFVLIPLKSALPRQVAPSIHA